MKDDHASLLPVFIVGPMGLLGLGLIVEIMGATLPWMPFIGFLMGDGETPVPMWLLLLRFAILIVIWGMYLVAVFTLLWLAAAAYIIIVALVCKRFLSAENFRQTVGPLRELPFLQKLTGGPLARMLDGDMGDPSA